MGNRETKELKSDTEEKENKPKTRRVTEAQSMATKMQMGNDGNKKGNGEKMDVAPQKSRVCIDSSTEIPSKQIRGKDGRALVAKLPEKPTSMNETQNEVSDKSSDKKQKEGKKKEECEKKWFFDVCGVCDTNVEKYEEYALKKIIQLFNEFAPGDKLGDANIRTLVLWKWTKERTEGGNLLKKVMEEMDKTQIVHFDLLVEEMYARLVEEYGEVIADLLKQSENANFAKKHSNVRFVITDKGAFAPTFTAWLRRQTTFRIGQERRNSNSKKVERELGWTEKNECTGEGPSGTQIGGSNGGGEEKSPHGKKEDDERKKKDDNDAYDDDPVDLTNKVIFPGLKPLGKRRRMLEEEAKEMAKKEEAGKTVKLHENTNAVVNSFAGKTYHALAFTEISKKETNMVVSKSFPKSILRPVMQPLFSSDVELSGGFSGKAVKRVKEGKKGKGERKCRRRCLRLPNELLYEMANYVRPAEMSRKATKIVIGKRALPVPNPLLMDKLLGIGVLGARICILYVKHVAASANKFLCGQCDALFTVEQLFVEHVNEHVYAQMLPPFHCRWATCKRKEPFDMQYNLALHTRRHTGERPYQCEFRFADGTRCEKRYSCSTNKRQHQTRVHNIDAN